MSYEYELCYKCHSSYTVLLTATKESYKKFDKAAEFVIAATNYSYHPIEGAGTNQTSQMTASLNGGTRWQFTTGSTIRCTNCHGDYRELAKPKVGTTYPRGQRASAGAAHEPEPRHPDRSLQ